MSDADKLDVISEMLAQFRDDKKRPNWTEIAEAIGYTPKTHNNPSESARGFWRRNRKSYVREKVRVKYDGENQIEITSEHDQITTPPELYEYCKINLDEWVEHKVEITKSTAKVAADVHKDLMWDDGVMTGINRRGPTLLIPVVRIKSTLIKKHPDSIEPVVQPVTVKGTIKEPKPPKSDKPVMRWLIGGDEQIGFERVGDKIITYHDRLAMDVFVQIANEFDWDGILLLGDLGDWTEFGTYTLTPNQYGLSQSTVCEGHYHLKRLRLGSPNTPIKWLLGNHDERPERAVESNIKGLWDVKLPTEIKLNLPPVYHPARLMDAPSLHIDWSDGYPDGVFWLSDYLQAIHGERYKPGMTSTMSKSIEFSVVQGHGHNAEVSFHTRYTRQGKKYVMALANGCLCKVGGDVPGRKQRGNWQQTVSVVEFYEDAQIPTVTIVPIIEGTAVYNGKVFTGQDYREALVADSGWDQF